MLASNFFRLGTLSIVVVLFGMPRSAEASWANERCHMVGGGPSKGLLNGSANPKLACCSQGWNEDAPGSKKDCVETRTQDFDNFEELYNYPGMGGGPTTSDSVDRPNRVFVYDSVTKKPIPGFYTPEGTRCTYLSPKRVQDQYDLFDAAALSQTVPTAAVGPNCTRLVRVAMVVTCPPVTKVNLVAIHTVSGVDYVRCTAAMNIRFHIGIIDLIPVDGKHTRYHIVTSYDPSGTEAGKSLDLVRTPSIHFSKILKLLTPTSCESPASPDLTYDGSTGKCRIN